MRARVLTLALLALPSAGLAQPIPAEPDLFATVKDMPIGSRARLSFSGELRERFESYAPPGFGLSDTKLDQYLLQRILFGADLKVEESFRAYVQLIHAVQIGRNPVGPTDSDHTDLAQGFLEIALPIGEGRGPALRAGRQEVALGSQRLVSMRDGANVRRAFDGFRLFHAFKDLAVDVMALRPVTLRDGAFDDTTNPNQALWGVYTTLPVGFVPGLNADLYYLGFENRRAEYGDVSGVERRHTVGIRLFGTAQGWDWNFEGAYQFGAFANQTISAWTVASDTGFTFDALPWKPRLGLKANIASGDRRSGDGTLGTFNALFPRLPYFSEANLVVPANFFDVFPSLQVRPLPNVTLAVGWDFLWRQSLGDAVYGPPFSAYPGTAGTSGRSVGNQVMVEARWEVTPHVVLAGSYVHFYAGQAITQAGGRSVDYFMASASFRF